MALKQTRSPETDTASELERLRLENERLRARNHELEERHRQHVRLFESLPAGMACYDRTLRIVAANPAYAQMVGLPLEQIIGSTASELGRTMSPEVVPMLERIIETGEPWHSYNFPLFYERDGVRYEGYRDALRIPVRDEAGAICGLVVLIYDVSERVSLQQEFNRQQAELAHQQRLTERIVEHAPVAMAYLDRDLVYRWNNPSHARMLGKSLEELRDRHVSEAFPAIWARNGHLYRQVIETGQANHQLGLAVPVSTDGEQLSYWDCSYIPVLNDAQKPVGLLALGVEASRRVEQEQSQRERIDQLEQIDRFKDEFLSIVSHELRTPLNFISGFASVLKAELDGPLNDAQHEHVGRIVSGADRMLLLINDLLDIAKIRAGHLRLRPAPFLYAQMVAETADLMRAVAERKGVTLEIAEVPDLLLVADGGRLGQVLSNLIANAIKFTEAEGTVRVCVHLDGEILRTEVSDTGCGIAPEDLPKLFTRFGQLDMSSTRPAGGAGLGLAICKAIMDAQAGSIGVESTPGTGSTFWFAMPLG